MIYSFFILILIILVFIIASIEDIKKREVYDYLNFSLTFLIIILAVFHSIEISNLEPIKYVILGLLIGFTFGTIIYYIGLLGGGDSKFLIGFGAASYYLLDFTKKSSSEINLIFQNLLENMTSYISLFFDIFLKAIIYTDLIFIFIILFFLLKNIYLKNYHILKNQILLLGIIIFLSLGFYNYENPIALFSFGFLSFILIFFADEKIFSSIYLIRKKKISELEDGDIIDNVIRIDEKKVIPNNKENFTLNKEDIIELKRAKINNNKQIHIRIIFPFSILIAINYFIYIARLISSDPFSLNILYFMLTFLFLSFLIAGIISLLILVYYIIINYSKINLVFNKIEKTLLWVLFFLSIILSFFFINFLYLLIIIFFYFLIKVVKNVESLVFVQEKPIEKIVPGDWIAEDVIIDKKTIYSLNDFKLGINEEQIKNLNLLKSKGKIKSIKVKDGIAFLPPMFIAFVFMLI
jgi:hypothetical protein